ncbi:MAG TPA: hypothetical protein VJQ09_03195, partial [Candidatus Limnocylindria bacterium]|nr:hypothetical protein [Candidatus Limnocylindria bacterium]
DSARRVAAAARVARCAVFAGASAPYGDEIRAIAVAGAPLVYLSYLTETADVTNLRDQRTIVTWPGAREIGVLSFGGASARFLRAFIDRYGPPSTLAASAYDALALIDAAAERAPSELDASRLRLRLEATTLRGVAATYSFTPSRHVGFPADALAYLRWDAIAGLPTLAPGQRGTDR